jgi:hypothetical protein
MGAFLMGRDESLQRRGAEDAEERREEPRGKKKNLIFSSAFLCVPLRSLRLCGEGSSYALR